MRLLFNVASTPVSLMRKDCVSFCGGGAKRLSALSLSSVICARSFRPFSNTETRSVRLGFTIEGESAQ
ncbi:hypothetical protein D3C83_309120 [compost metagenome]